MNKSKITTDKSNNKEIETFLFDYLDEMETDWSQQARYTLTIDEDGYGWIEGSIGYWYDAHTDDFYGDFEDDMGLPAGSATIYVEAEDDNLENKVLEATMKICGC